MYTLRRLTTFALIVSVVLLGSTKLAYAHQSPIGSNASSSSNGSSIISTAQDQTGSPGQDGHGGALGSVTCVYTQFLAYDFGGDSSGRLGGVTDYGEVIAPNTPGKWAFEGCYRNGVLIAPLKIVFLHAGGGVNPARLLITARNQLVLPAPPIQMSPATNHWQYVQVPTWAWVPTSAWVPLTQSTSAGSVTVTVVATPVQLVFSYQVSGKGLTRTATCNGPGTPYSDWLAERENPKQAILAASPDCGWTWHQSSADTPDQKYAVSAHIVYHTVWSVQGAPGGGDLGGLPSLDTNVRLTVGEIQAVNVPDP